MDASKIVAPQKCDSKDLTETCHGIGDGASWPPTISDVLKSLFALVIKDGINAKRKNTIIAVKLTVEIRWEFNPKIPKHCFKW